jgi:predicted DNA-binding transcriptional regulator AlpA
MHRLDRLLPLARVARLMSVRQSVVLRWVNDEEFPEPIVLPGGLLRWSEMSLWVWLEGKKQSNTKATPNQHQTEHQTEHQREQDQVNEAQEESGSLAIKLREWLKNKPIGFEFKANLASQEIGFTVPASRTMYEAIRQLCEAKLVEKLPGNSGFKVVDSG